jgi:membrane-anchored mycosin MYCP
MAPPDPNELIVDLEHLDLVTAELVEYKIEPALPVSTDTGLGLALLTLPDSVVEVDALLAELRRAIGGRYSGWVPVMGKNRTINGVIGTGTSKPMQAGEPVAAPVGASVLGPPAGAGVLGTSKPMQLDEPATPKVDSPGLVPGGPAAPEAGHGVVVGLIDTPFDPDSGLATEHTVHAEPPLALPEPDPLLLFTAAPPRAGHGTFVASLVLAQAPRAELIVDGVLDPATGHASTWKIAQSILALAERVQVLNLSFGCYTADGQPPLVLGRAIERMRPGVLVVAAAGNHGRRTGWDNGLTKTSATWPAALPTVVAVGARSESDDLADFTPVGPWITCTAPGENVHGAYLHGPVAVHDAEGKLFPQPFDGSAVWSGTSFAAATVSGAIAARMSAGSGLTARQALAELLADNKVVRQYTVPS